MIEKVMLIIAYGMIGLVGLFLICNPIIRFIQKKLDNIHMNKLFDEKEEKYKKFHEGEKPCQTK